MHFYRLIGIVYQSNKQMHLKRLKIKKDKIMKVQEVIDLINDKEIYSLYEVEYTINPHGTKRCPKVASGLNLDEHRWYSIATDVYQCEDGFVGITGAYQSFSEMQTWEDIGVICGAEEYKAIQTITYVPL